MKSLKNQLLLIFLTFVLVSLLTAFYTSYYFSRKEEIYISTEQISGLEIMLLKGLKEQENYYNFEAININYYSTKESQYLDNYKLIYNSFIKKLEEINGLNNNKTSAKKGQEILLQMNKFNSLFKQMVLSIEKRGFKNFGIEGEMRMSIHALESIEELDLVQILTLRRHEKDFIIRQDQVYHEKHYMVVSQLKEEIKNNKLLSIEKQQLIIKTLSNYSRQFDELTSYDRMIGLKLNTGFKKKLNQHANQLIMSIDELKNLALIHQNKLLFRLNASISVFWVIYLIFATWISNRIAGKFTMRLKMLSNRINHFVNSNFSMRLSVMPKVKDDEVGKLWSNFMKMEQEIVEYIELFKEKVDEKTKELSKKNDEIERQKHELEIKKEESDRKNKDLLDGIRYGWRIQRALLPTNNKFKKQLEKGFVFFSPKDIVSGDIYWVHKEKVKNQEECIFAVIDCTGHGVPGAFMSILATNAINHSVLNKGHKQPSKVLKNTNNFVFNAMKYYNTTFDDYLTKDGMDMLLCKLNREKLKLEYSGANRPLYIVRDYKNKRSEQIGLSEDKYRVSRQSGAILFEIFPTKKTVGTLNDKQSNLFENREIDVREKDMIYLTSDGYADQFGGPKNKKFMVNRLKNMLMLIHELRTEEQEAIFQQTILDWKGEEEQIDDITIMGVRV